MIVYLLRIDFWQYYTKETSKTTACKVRDFQMPEPAKMTA